MFTYNYRCHKRIYRHYIAIFSLILLLFINSSDLNAQCFASPGNPVAGSANLGVLNKGTIRAIGFYQYSLLDKYFDGSRISEHNPVVTSAYYNYSGFSVGYGITPNFSVETEAGYFFNRTRETRFGTVNSASGLSNAIISGKYNIYRDRIKNLEFSVSLGARLPFSTSPVKDEFGEPLHIDVQPSTGDFGGVLQTFFVKEFDIISARVILINRFERSFNENKMGYKFGDSFISSLFLSKHLANPYTDLTKDITVILQLRHEYRDKNLRNGSQVTASGSNLLFLSPQLNYNLKMLWNFSIMMDIPVYQYYNGIQLGHSYAFTFSVTRDLGFGI